MYKNGKLQAKRIARKLGEASFDLEVARDWLFDMDYNNVEQWEEAVATLNELRAEVAMACDLAESALSAVKDDPAPNPPTGEQVTNPFAAKNPQTVSGDKNQPRDKAKGG